MAWVEKVVGEPGGTEVETEKGLERLDVQEKGEAMEVQGAEAD